MKTPTRIALLLAVLAAIPAPAQEGRQFNPIARPAAAPPLPAGATRVSPPRPIAKERIEEAVAQVASAWNERRVDRVLAPGFQRAQELSDAMQTKVPRDAVLRVMAIQGWQVLEQYRRSAQLVSKVSVTVRTQVEFGDAAAGYQVRDGINEYVITLTDAEAP
jgi:hypothetical protein